MLQLSEFCEANYMSWHTYSVKFWLGDLNLTGGKPRAASTLTQKISHINMLVDLQPPLIPGPKLQIGDLAKGLGGLHLVAFKSVILPAWFIITLKNLEHPQMIHTAVQFQTLTGLRAGQMSLIMPAHLQTVGRLWIAPFKHCDHAQILDITHVPAWLTKRFLSTKTPVHTPILPWTPDQYKVQYKKLTATYKLPHTSHASRHTFASIQRFLSTPLPRIAQALCHKTGKTLPAYVHALSPQDQQVVLDNLDYFKPLSLMPLH